ncbi:MAG: hypothetical protein CMM76_11360 [Rhodospirillaceae bacterium]|nr:hypothetical protein [Rhodospirillaceae bacterium]
MWRWTSKMTDTDMDTETDAEFLRTITIEDLALLGADEIVYVKPVTVDSKIAFSVNLADGRPVALVDNFESAIASAIENELFPMSVH